MKKRATWGLLATLVLTVALAGCATLSNAPAKPGAEPTALQKAQSQSLYFLSWYKAQFSDAASMGALAQEGKLSAGQLRVYRIKRELLIKAKPLIETYDAIVAGGGIPSPDREQEILDLINRLAAAG